MHFLQLIFHMISNLDTDEINKMKNVLYSWQRYVI